MKDWIFIACYWIVSCIIVYANRYRSNKNPLNKVLKQKTKPWEHLLIVLLSPIAAPIMIIVFAYKGCQFLYYRNRPKPLPKAQRAYMKKDRVLDEKNTAVSISEYNYVHGTEYTLDDVYGKGYTESLSEDLKAEISAESTKFGVLDVQENIPVTPYTDASIVLGLALISGEFADFEKILAEDVIHVGYKKDTISGKNEVVEYWKGWRTRYVETRKCKKFEVVYSNYYSNACLLLEMMVVMFIFRDNKIQKVLLIQRHLSPTIGFHEDVLEPQFDLSCIKHCLSELRQPNEIGGPVVKENRIPCMTCGMPSEQLEWHSSLFEFGDIAYSGDVSVCTHCHKVVEYEPIIRHRYAEPVEPKKAKQPISHRYEKPSYNPKLFGLRNFEGSDSMKGTKYVEALSGKTREAVENTNWFLLSTLTGEELEKAKQCYMNAFEDGVAEAANILGVLLSNFENKDDEGKDMFRKAMDAGSHNAMLNLFTVLWTEEKYEEAGELLKEVNEKPSPSLKCLWNLAFFHFMGEDYAHNPIKKKNEAAAIKILKKILEKGGDLFCDEDSDVFKAAKDLKNYIGNGNIFASKAKDYHWRIKTNLDSLKKKGDDAVFYDLSALSLEKGYHMGLRTAEQEGMGDESNFYVYNKNDVEDKDLLKYIHAEETAMGAWQVYLLMTSPSLLPTFWHGGYIRRKFILEERDLYDIESLSTYDLSTLATQDMLYPSVEIKRDGDIVTANVFCCYWSEWGGLIRDHIEMQIQNGKVISYEDKGAFVIYKYDCGILF